MIPTCAWVIVLLDDSIVNREWSQRSRQALPRSILLCTISSSYAAAIVEADDYAHAASSLRMSSCHAVPACLLALLPPLALLPWRESGLEAP